MALISTGTSGDKIAAGTTAQRPAVTAADTGMIRFNKTRQHPEIYTGSTWKDIDYVPTPEAVPPDKTYSSNTNVGGAIECNNLTINSGVTLTLDKQAVIFTVYGDAKILGTINANGKGPLGGGGLLGWSTGTSAHGVIGSGFGASSRNSPQPATPYPPSASILSSGGCSSTTFLYVNGHMKGGNGGDGGGSVVIRCFGTITMSGTITANGGDAGNGSFYDPPGTFAWAGAGGGAGGCVILHGDNGISKTGTISVKGGKGGPPGVIDGGNFHSQFTGGGGGGGGWIVLQTKGSLVNTGSNIVTGGLADMTVFPPSGGITVDGEGCPGASYGGQGGGFLENGGNGHVTFSGSPF